MIKTFWYFCVGNSREIKKISFKAAIKKSILIDNMISEMSKQIRFQQVPGKVIGSYTRLYAAWFLQLLTVFQATQKEAITSLCADLHLYYFQLSLSFSIATQADYTELQQRTD